MLRPSHPLDIASKRLLPKARDLTLAVSFASLSLITGCSATGGARHGSSVEVRPGIGKGSTTIEPSHYPTYRGVSEIPEGKADRMAVGGVIGFVVCRIGGANYIVSVGCGAIGAAIGSASYSPDKDRARDIQSLINKVATLSVHQSYSENSRLRPSLTNHVYIDDERVVRGTFYKRFRVTYVDTGGNTSSYFGVISRPASGGRFVLENRTHIPS